MVTVPQRLKADSRVTLLLDEADVVVLRKDLREPLLERSSYLSMHALSIVQNGTQAIQTEGKGSIRIDANQAGIIQRGLYTISDLLAGECESFSATIIFFSDELVQRLTLDKTKSTTKTSTALALHRIDTPNLPINWSKASVLNLLEELPVDLSHLLRVQKSPLREFMSEHFDKPLAIADYAYLTGRSERSFRRDFKVRFGESPKRWLITQRLEKSRVLLQTQQVRSVQEAAISVGYASVSHFIQLYSSYFGITPGVEVQ